ncbi:MAG: TRAP transporter small permease [Alphaproteobacteria bacterium]|jgi:TRAP-type C4-dicarboxylate transport system permease small subunit|nr:TRAP transporter small permease [Alphaproteobacteria bacterium]MBT4083482.1 TRAP transporter small permease [Alphaproteobacteria bacterium]MBT4544927.1 TRAP transporter small permease [Alphaproteobacteria bacterium]MBT7743714.1 TRAP transporter small permease [Alphaproteobacteria bacterium]
MEEELSSEMNEGQASKPGPRFLAKLEQAGRDISSLLILVLGIVVVSSAAARLVPILEIPDHYVITGELMVTLVALPWAFVTADRGHISVEVFTGWVSPRTSSYLYAFAALVALIMVLPLTWAAGLVFYEAYDYGNYFDGALYLPEWPGRLTFFVGFALMSLRMVLLLVSDGISAIRGDGVTPGKIDEFF